MREKFFSTNKRLLFLALWICISIILLVLTQAPSYQYETINWDESTFTIMGADLNRGHLPYIYTLDSKPPFLYANFAVALFLFGNSVFSVRLLGDLFILLSALFIYLILNKLTRTIYALIGSWFFIAMFAPSFAQYTSSENIAILYLIIAMWILLNFERNRITAFAAGIAMSLAVLVRTNLVLTAVAGVAIYLFDLWSTKQKSSIIHSIFYIIGGFLPIVLLVAIYALNHALNYLFLGLIEIPLSYSASRYSIWDLFIRHGYLWLKFITKSPFIAGPITLLALYITIAGFIRFYSHRNSITNAGIVKTFIVKNVKLIYVCLIFIATVVSMFLSGGVYSHYQIQLFPFIIILIFGLIDQIFANKAKKLLPIGLIILLSANLMSFNESLMTLSNLKSIQTNFPGRKIEQLIEDKITAQDKVLAFDQHITLLYLDKEPILPIITHPSNFGKESYVNVLYHPTSANFDLLEVAMGENPKVILINSGFSEGALSAAQQKKLSEIVEEKYNLLDVVENCAVYVLNEVH